MHFSTLRFLFTKLELRKNVSLGIIIFIPYLYMRITCWQNDKVLHLPSCTFFLALPFWFIRGKKMASFAIRLEK